MEITYLLEHSDYWQYGDIITRRTPTLMRQAFLRLLVVPLLLELLLIPLHLKAPAIWAWLVIIPAVWVGLMVSAQKRTMRRAADMRPGALGPHVMCLSADGLREKTSVMEVSVQWEKVTEIFQADAYLIILINPIFGFIMPLRAFQTPEQAQAFTETALAYWQAARDGTVPALPPAVSSSQPALRQLS